MAKQLLSQSTVDDLAGAGGELLVVDSKDGIAQTFLAMARKNILCAPVYDKTSKKFIGLIDMIDIACFVVDIVNNTEKLGTDYFAFLEREEEFSGRTASDVADLSQRNKLFPVKTGVNLLEAIKIMAANHLQRVPVMDASGEKIISLLTQSAVVAYLAKNLSHLGPNMNKSLKELGFLPKQVIAIEYNRRAVDAFKLMAEHRISGVPVLDIERKLMANVSARDLRSLQHDARLFKRLFHSVSEFVSAVRQSETDVMHPSISCTFDDSFQKVVLKMAATRIHRIYVIDEHRCPVSVVSLHDVLLKILELDQGVH